jgi:TolB-like protein
MKKPMVFILLCVFALAIPSMAGAEFKRTKIAVLDFETQGAGFSDSDMGKVVAEWLITALVKNGRFDVVERRLLEKILGEQRLHMSGVVDQSSAAKVGKLLGVKIIISGSVVKFQNSMEANARIIDVESASIIAAESVKSSTATRLEDLVIQMADIIIKDFPLEGYVIKRDQNEVSIDLGRQVGVKRGMRFVVFKEGDPIKHPRTGEILEVEKIDTGVIEIESTSRSISKGHIIEETSPDSIQYGQMVRSVLMASRSIQQYNAPVADLQTQKPASTLLAQLQGLDPSIEEIRQLRGSGNAQWEVKFKELLVTLKGILGQNPTSPDVYIYYGKAYDAAGNFKGAYKSVAGALKYDPQNLEATVYQGELCYNYGKDYPPGHRNRIKLATLAQQQYESAINLNQDKGFQAMMYLKIGDVHAELMNDREKAKQYWQSAVSTAPYSEAAQLAGERATH